MNGSARVRRNEPAFPELINFYYILSYYKLSQDNGKKARGKQKISKIFLNLALASAKMIYL